MKISKILGQTILLTSFGVSAFAMTETTMQDKMMKDDKMMATGTKMMEDKMMMEKESKMKMMMAITRTSPRSEVAKLQQHLIEEGFLVVPKWVRLGYYGPLTRAAYAKYSEKMKMMGEKMEDKMMKNDKMMVK